MPSQNTKFLVQEQGSSLIETDAPKPTAIGTTEVVTRLKAVAINPADVKMIDQGHRVSSWPLVPGLDGAGFVEAIGTKVDRFAVGDRVLAQFVPGDRGGSCQKFSVVEESLVAKVPDVWSFEDAATLGYVSFLSLDDKWCFHASNQRGSDECKLTFAHSVCYFTAMVGLGVGLETPLPFLPGGSQNGYLPSSVLVLGGSSALGAATIQLLRLAVPECKILTTSSPKHHKHLTNTLSANAAFDRNSTSLVEEVKSASPSTRGVEAIFDAVGAGSIQRGVFESFDPDGPKSYAQVWTGDDEVEVPAGVNSILFRGRDLPKLQGHQNIMRALQTLLEQGTYKLPLPVFNMGNGLDGLEKGLDAMRKGVSGKKLVVTI